MVNVIFRCPNTGMNVQHSLDERPDAGADEVVAVHCPACARIHLFNVAEQRLLGGTPTAENG